MKLLIARLLLIPLSWLPPAVIHALAFPLGRLAWWLPWRKKQVAARNLERCLGERTPGEREMLVRDNLVEMARLVLESGAVWRWPLKRLQRHIRSVEGWEHIEAAQADKRGLLMVSAHLGNWELAALYLSAHLPAALLYTPPRDPALNAALVTSRSRFGGHMVAAGGPGMRRILKSLRDGETVGLLCDQQPRRGDGVFAPFFSRPALTMTLVGRLARKTGCQVLFGHCLRDARGGWRMIVEPAPPAIADPDPVTAAAALNAMVERGIRRAPEQYLWLYKRFKLQPPGQPDPYA